MTIASVDDGLPNTDGIGHISWATSNSEAMRRLMELYARPGQTVIDPTFGKGVFWKSVDVGQYDFHPSDLINGVDVRSLPFEDASVDVAVYDPPYRYVERTTVPSHVDEQYQLSGSLRLATRPGIDGVLDLYQDGIAEMMRVLRRGGFLFVKCQDTAGDGKQTWVHIEVMEMCRKADLEPVDLLVVVTERPPPTRWKIQRSLKKAHSYFIVARKGGFYPFGYRAVQKRISTPTPGAE